MPLVQDKDDDQLAGMRSTALHFGEKTRQWLTGFGSLTMASLAYGGLQAGLGTPFFLISICKLCCFFVFCFFLLLLAELFS